MEIEKMNQENKAKKKGSVGNFFRSNKFKRGGMATLMGVVFGAIAGVMVYISLDELLPSAEEYGEHHQAMLGLIAGMAVMAVSLLLFA